MGVFDTVAVLEFEELPGEEIRMTLSLPTREYIAALRTLQDPDDTLTVEAWLEAIAAIVDKYRISWTLTGDALDQPRGLLVAICREWLRAVSQVPLPLARKSSATAASPEPS